MSSVKRMLLLSLLLPAVAWAQPTVTLVAFDADIGEQGTTPNTGTFRFTRDGGTGAALTVTVTFDGTTTVSTSDYSDTTGGQFPSFGNVIIPSGSSFFDLVITPLADNLVEAGGERLDITLDDSGGTFIAGTPGSAGMTIADDPAIVTVSTTDAVVGEAGPDPGTFTFTRSGGKIAAGLTVNVTFDGTTTVSTSDYSDTTGGQFQSFGNVNIPAGFATFDLVITPLADGAAEGNEQLDITLNATGSYNVGTPASAVMTIVDDAAIVSIETTDAVVAEAGPNPGTFTFTRSGGKIADALTVTVTFDVTTTVSTSDYSDTTGGQFPSFGNVIIPAGDASFDLIITPISDGVMEGDERLDITLAASGSYLVGMPSSAGMTIADYVEDIFIDGFESPVVKRCSAEKALEATPWRFHDQGAAILDLDTHLWWSRCGIEGYFDWLSESCFEDAYATAPVQASAATVAAFNAGLIGDNLGFSDWRLATPGESQTLAAMNCRNLLVRDLD